MAVESGHRALEPLPGSSTSGRPRRLVSGIRQSSKTADAVSLARIPILCSSLVIFSPGVPASTTKGFMPARPAWGSTVAHTTMKPSESITDLWPLVTKIFSPFSTHSSPSRTAVVRMAAVSEPQWGSVMAMLAHLGLPSR